MADRAKGMTANFMAKKPLAKIPNLPLAKNTPEPLAKIPLAKIPRALDSVTSDFSPMEFSPMPDHDFSPMPDPEFSPIESRVEDASKSSLQKAVPAQTQASPPGIAPHGISIPAPKKKKKVSPARLRLVEPKLPGKRGRPRNKNLPPAPGDYFYWTKAGNGLKLERRDDLKAETYEYIGFIRPDEWQHLKGDYDDEHIMRLINSAFRIKRARTAQSRGVGKEIA